MLININLIHFATAIWTVHKIYLNHNKYIILNHLIQFNQQRSLLCEQKALKP
jgi:hypothetical protein